MNKIVRIGEPNIILQVLDELYDNIVYINSKYNTYGVKLDKEFSNTYAKA